MKVIVDNTSLPFFLAHGGAKTQILSTANALRDLGVEVEFARWWEPAQKADIIHVFSVPNRAYIDFAKHKGIVIVNTTLFTGACNRSDLRLTLQGVAISAIRALPNIPPIGVIRSRFPWSNYAACDMNIVGLDAEVEVLKRCYGVAESRIRKIPLGLTDAFIRADNGSRDCRYLITTGIITERKRSVELALLAKETGVPICFVGKPYDQSDPYWKKFKSLIDDDTVNYVSHTESVEEMVELLQTSRGFVLYSDYENWCLSAHEADACGLPLLLPDQRWSRERFGDKASYLTLGDIRQNRSSLKSFYESAPSMKNPNVHHYSWADVAKQHLEAYNDVLAAH